MRRLFEALVKDRNQFLNATKGVEFEDRIEAFLRSMRYSSLKKEDISDWPNLRKLTLLETGTEKIVNTYGIDSAFIRQPNSTQKYPDFVVFEADEVICIETKYAKPPRPVWNSGLPRPNGFYIIGTPKKRDITFFRGCDVVTAEEAGPMHQFFTTMRTLEREFNQQNLTRQRKGFSVYIRKAFAQGKQYNPDADTDFYGSPDRRRLEQRVLDYFSSGATSP